jgi:hypothetical protein
MTDVSKVAADLVHAPGFRTRLDEAEALAAGKHPQPRQRAHTAVVDGLDGQRCLLAAHAGQVGLVDAGKARINAERGPLRHAFDDRDVALVDDVPTKRV